LNHLPLSTLVRSAQGFLDHFALPELVLTGAQRLLNHLPLSTLVRSAQGFLDHFPLPKLALGGAQELLNYSVQRQTA
jgi:hypothetical protein